MLISCIPPTPLQKHDSPVFPVRANAAGDAPFVSNTLYETFCHCSQHGVTTGPSPVSNENDFVVVVVVVIHVWTTTTAVLVRVRLALIV